MEIITIHNAKTNLSKLVARAEAGEEIILARGNKQVARLVSVRPTSVVKPDRVPGGYPELASIGMKVCEP